MDPTVELRRRAALSTTARTLYRGHRQAPSISTCAPLEEQPALQGDRPRTRGPLDAIARRSTGRPAGTPCTRPSATPPTDLERGRRRELRSQRQASHSAISTHARLSGLAAKSATPRCMRSRRPASPSSKRPSPRSGTPITIISRRTPAAAAAPAKTATADPTTKGRDRTEGSPVDAACPSERHPDQARLRRHDRHRLRHHDGDGRGRVVCSRAAAEHGIRPRARTWTRSTCGSRRTLTAPPSRRSSGCAAAGQRA